MYWPVQLPDIGGVGLSRLREESSYTNLWQILEEAGQSISEEHLENLTDRMNKVCVAVRTEMVLLFSFSFLFEHITIFT